MGMNIIVTAGPTNERIDSVMKITNMSTGSLGSTVVDTLMMNEVLRQHIDKIYYISPELARKPVANDGRIIYNTIESAEDLKARLEQILTSEKIDLVVHSAAVGDYKARYSVRAESLAKEISDELFGAHTADREQIILNILKNPKCVSDDSGKMSSYEPNLMTMMDLTPKVIGCIKEKSPDTFLIGFKLLDGVSREELLDVAMKLRKKNNADIIIANDLSKIRDGMHWAMFVDKDGVKREAYGKQDIANGICDIAMGIVTEKYLNASDMKPNVQDMKHVVFVSVDKPARWSKWHSGSTATVYRSEPFDNEEQVEQFKQNVAMDYPDSNLADDKGGHEWHIIFTNVLVNMNDEGNFESLCRMMSSVGLYKDRR